MFVKAINWIFRKRKNEEQVTNTNSSTQVIIIGGERALNREGCDHQAGFWERRVVIDRGEATNNVMYMISDEPGRYDFATAEQSTFD